MTDAQTIEGTVNSMITDSVSQANIRTLGDTPAVAVGQLYASVAQALGEAAKNAVAGQQQARTQAQVTAAAAVERLLALVDGGAAAPEPVRAEAGRATQEVRSTVLASSPTQEIEHAVQVVLGDTLGSADEVAHAFRSSMDALSAALVQLSRAGFGDLLRSVQLGATAACLAAMIKSPDQAAAYEGVLSAIRQLGK